MSKGVKFIFFTNKYKKIYNISNLNQLISAYAFTAIIFFICSEDTLIFIISISINKFIIDNC